MVTRKLAVAVVIAVGTTLGAATLLPAAEPLPTLFEKLGITPGLQKLRDVTTNRRGNNPQWERTPQLKRIADPANLESDNLAIKTAAEIKQDQDLKPQKIKAIKFLAEVGCICHEGVQDALLAALTDCDSEVRLEAAVAVCMTAGNPSDPCSKGCCNAELMQKLHEMAYMQDEVCCWLEPDPAVRQAAVLALEACRAKHRPTVATEPEVERPEEPFEPEMPTEAPVEPEMPDNPSTQGAVNTPRPLRLVPGHSPAQATEAPQRSPSGLINPVTMHTLLDNRVVEEHPAPRRTAGPGYIVIERTAFND